MVEYSYFNMGGDYNDEKSYNQAIASYQKAIAINPENDGIYYNVGITYLNKKLYDEAITSYQKAIEINPKDDRYYTNIGVAYYKKQEYNQAIAFFQKAIEINLKADGAYYNMGIAYNNKKEYDHAIVSYQKSIAINPKRDEAYVNLGLLYVDRGEYTEAIEVYKKVLILKPKKYLGGFINLFELQIVMNKSVDGTLESKYVSVFKDNRREFISYEALKIIHNIINKKEVNLKAWQEKYKDIHFGWDLVRLQKWVKTIEDEGVKEELIRAFNVFERHNKKP